MPCSNPHASKQEQCNLDSSHLYLCELVSYWSSRHPLTHLPIGSSPAKCSQAIRCTKSVIGYVEHLLTGCGLWVFGAGHPGAGHNPDGSLTLVGLSRPYT